MELETPETYFADASLASVQAIEQRSEMLWNIFSFGAEAEAQPFE